MQSKNLFGRRFVSVLSISWLITFSACSHDTGPKPALITPHPSHQAEADTATLIGKAAPEFSLQTLDKRQVKLSDQKGKVVMLDFWATWCPPCRKSLPHVQQIATDQSRLKRGLVVWVVNDKEDDPTVRSFLEETKYTFTVPMDTTGDVLKKYLVEGIPTTVIIGRDGTIRKAFVGLEDGTAEQIDKALDEALSSTSTASAN